jgi:hypothetical protein
MRATSATSWSSQGRDKIFFSNASVSLVFLSPYNSIFRNVMDHLQISQIDFFYNFSPLAVN